MYVLALLIEIIAVYIAIKHTKQVKKRKQLNRIPKKKTAEKTISPKEKEHAEKTKQKKQQAESDIIFFQSQYDTLYQLARQIESDIQETEKQVEIDKLMNSYDKAKSKEKKLYQLVKKQVSIENQLYSMQSRINKAKYILQAV